MRKTAIAPITIMIVLSVFSCFYSISLVRGQHIEMSGVFRYDLDGKWRCGLNVTIVNDYGEPVLLHWISLEVAGIFYLDGTYELLDYLLNDTSINIVILNESNATFSYNLTEAGFDKEPKSMTVWCIVSTDRYSLVDAQNIVSENNYPVHNFNTSLNYQSIQEAIDANETLNGHMIGVEAGTYYEHVMVNKPLTFIGEERETTIIDGNSTGNVIEITANSVNVRGFTIQKSGTSHQSCGFYISELSTGNTISCNLITNNFHGILPNGSSNNIISGNKITNNDQGIYLSESSNNNITSNHITNNVEGVYLVNSSSNTVSGNNITNNGDGVYLYSSSNNTVSRNDITNNDDGVILDNSLNNNISSNRVTNNTFGIGLSWGSNYNIISDNNITKETLPKAYGILVFQSSYNNILGNKLANNMDGIRIYYTKNNSISGNTIVNNDYGIRLRYETSNNTIYYNNFVNNTQQVIDETSWEYSNIWDDNCGGNYWSNYAGVDSDGDGIGDAPHSIDGSNTDDFPLMNPYWNPADINHDLKVDIFDVVSACVAYSSTPSDINWNCHCDVAEPNGVIDIFDIVMICSSYGEEY